MALLVTVETLAMVENSKALLYTHTQFYYARSAIAQRAL
ncbi:hypothetical protein FOTG_19006 [Fusarium oxysporum f. sp. vasinfectum 25433]|uniref:Uncharacterized protein n=1 Tax=Fusarium oxysporum f. sp. vasinfectum 25433 TaxID=1089449 RepID=X0KG58_FUSOX|nr:hypothetical protein FOTG_19006 [Fusarium oxysporum f. sp. vasinfectum 25433]